MILSCKQKNSGHYRNHAVTTETEQSQPKHWVFCKKLKIVSTQFTFCDGHWLNVFLIS